MSSGEHLQKLAERVGKGDSAAMHKILACAMTDDEAAFILELPATPEELATSSGSSARAVEEKILGLARRGLYGGAIIDRWPADTMDAPMCKGLVPSFKPFTKMEFVRRETGLGDQRSGPFSVVTSCSHPSDRCGADRLA